MTGSGTVRLGTDRLRVASWHGDARTALVSPASDAPTPSVGSIERCVELLAARGVERVLTGALAEPEQAPFRAAGFEEHERLHLLAHDLRRLPELPVVRRTQRVRAGQRLAVLEVDRAAFDDFWRLDAQGLDDAVRATVSSRFRVVNDGPIVGYAITGRSGGRGYLQRLAVHPEHRRRGVAGSLVVDGLRWLRRHGAAQVVVNTQESNGPALALYQHLGFALQPHGLAVLAREVAPSTR